MDTNGLIPVLLVNVGSNERPADEEDIRDIAAQFKKVVDGESSVIVTHHLVSTTLIYMPKEDITPDKLTTYERDTASIGYVVRRGDGNIPLIEGQHD